MVTRGSHRRFDSAFSLRDCGLPVFGHGAWHPARNRGAFDAAARFALYDGGAADELAFGWQHARGKHAAGFANHRPNFSLHPLRQFRPGNSLPWCRDWNRLAEFRDRDRTRLYLLRGSPGALSPDRSNNLNLTYGFELDLI